MKKFKIKTLFAIISALLVCALSVGCGMRKDFAGGGEIWDGASAPNYDYSDGNKFDEITENPFVECTEENKTQAVSLTVNTAAFPLMRRYLDANMAIPKDAVKIEEIINYFDYDYARPNDGKTVALSGAVADTPWNGETKLAVLGVQAKTVETENVKQNIVLLVDVSGSMSGNDRLDLVKKSFIALAETLDEDDVLSIVTYASGSEVVLDGARGNDLDTIKSALNKLRANGSTYGEGGIELAYETAFRYKNDCDNSIIFIATDGDFNVGKASAQELKDLISEKRRQGVYLSALGYGFNNLSDSNMQALVEAGQGAYAYIDSLDTAKAVLIGDRDGILYFVGEEAKAQIEFNPDVVKEFRLIGFENKMLTNEEFEDSSTPAGALSSGSQVTAVFEIKLHENAQGDFGKFTAAYHERGGEEEKREDLVLSENLYNPQDGTVNAIKKADIDFISALVEASLILRDSEYKANASYEAVQERIGALNLEQNDKKYEFVEFMRMLTGKE